MLTVALGPFEASGPRAARRTLVACRPVLLISGISAMASKATSAVIETRYVTANVPVYAHGTFFLTPRDGPVSLAQPWMWIGYRIFRSSRI